jgi:hypothetical protein
MKIQEGSYEELSKLLEKQDLAKQIKDQLILINQNKFRLPQMNYLEKIMSNDPQNTFQNQVKNPNLVTSS